MATSSSSKQQQLRKRKWEEADAGVPVEVSTPEKIIVHEIRPFFTNQGREHKPWRTSLLNRARTAVQDQGLRLKRATVWTTDWMLQGGIWQTFFSAAVCVYSLSFFTYKCLMMDILLLLLLLGSDLAVRRSELCVSISIVADAYLLILQSSNSLP
jgi:hypothetical protein